MKLKDIATQLTSAVQTVPNLVKILKEGFEQATAGSTVTVTQVVSSGTKIASIKVDNDTTNLYAPSSTHAYSTTEHVVGAWIDNSPVYERTFELTETVNITSSWSSAVLDIDASQLLSCVCTRSNGALYCDASIDTGKLKIRGGINTSLGSGDKITLTYLKAAS